MALEEQFMDKLAESEFGNGEKQSYLPEGCVDELINEVTIRENLKDFVTVSEQKPPDQKMLVEFVEQKAKKVFAITTLFCFEGNKLCRAMQQFQEHGFVDDDLPVFDARKNSPARIQNAFGDNGLWTQFKRFMFEKNKWAFLVPVLTDSQLIYKLDRECILPFKGVSSQNKEGTFGDVFEVEVHASHQKGEVFMVNGKRANVAVKEIVARETNGMILDDVKTAWSIEARALGKISKVKHENLIQCIAAITRGERYYFLFPWADGGSLREFWRSMPNPDLTPVFVRNVLEQLYGLAGALNKMHSYQDEAAVHHQGSESGSVHQGTDSDAIRDAAPGSGGIRHGDLKPENILRFASGDSKGIGTLKIADMGLAKHHEVNTRLRKNLTSTKYGTARYEPPEVGATRLTSPATSRLYDMWSMGCIILELIIWLLYGYDELVIFHNSIGEDSISTVEPPYYIIDNLVGQEKVAKVRPFVTKRIAQLSGDKACTRHTALGDLLAIVETKLLVVPLPPSRTTTINENISITPAPSPEPNDGHYRATAKVLCDSLSDILAKSTGSLHPDSAQELGDRLKDAPTPKLSPLLATRMKENVSKALSIVREHFRQIMKSTTMIEIEIKRRRVVKTMCILTQLGILDLVLREPGEMA